MNTKKNDQANQIKQAISILRENNDKVTVKAVSDLTGIHIQTLYKHSAIRDLVRTHEKSHSKQHAKVKPLAADPQIPNIVLSQDVDSYMEHIRENYFSHAEALEDVKLDIRLTVSDFKDDMCNQAINKLLLSKELKQSGYSSNLFIGEFNPMVPVEEVQITPAREGPEFVIFNETTGEYLTVYGSDEVDRTVETLLKDNDYVLEIYKLYAKAKPKRVIAFEKLS